MREWEYLASYTLPILIQVYFQWVGNRKVAAASDNGSIHLWDWREDNSLAVVKEFDGHDDMVRPTHIYIYIYI